MEDRRRKAEEYFKQGYNCCQAVVLTFLDETGGDREELLRTASSFGGGMGRLREVCGAVSGMFFVLGRLCGYSDPTDREAKSRHYAVIQELAKKFSEINGSIVCRDLLKVPGAEKPEPEPRSESYYKKRPCAELVGDAVAILEKELIDLGILK